MKMRKQTKILLGILVLVLAAAVVMTSKNSVVFQGKLSKQPAYSNIKRCELLKKIVEAKDIPLQQINHRPSFQDVPSDSWCFFYAETAKQEGWTDGSADGNLYPANTLIRAEAVSVIVKAFELPQVTPPLPTFKDVSAATWYYAYIESAYASGADICNAGCSSNGARFNPTHTAAKTWAYDLVNSVASL